jgi:hypothetical protein
MREMIERLEEASDVDLLLLRVPGKLDMGMTLRDHQQKVADAIKALQSVHPKALRELGAKKSAGIVKRVRSDLADMVKDIGLARKAE